MDNLAQKGSVMRGMLWAVLATLLAFRSVAAAEESMTPEQFLKLAQAYQDGYLQLVTAAALQVYACTGTVATAFSKGQIDGPAAEDSLSDTALLHSTCYTTLLEIQSDTPKDDKAAQSQIGKMAAVLLLEKDLLGALGDVFSDPTDGNAKRVETARGNVEAALGKLLGGDSPPKPADKSKGGT